MQTADIKDLAEAYAAHSGLKLSTLGAYAVNDGKFFHRLEEGRGCTLRTYHKVLGWFDANWPADLEWPRHIPRPSRRKAVA